MARRRLGFWRRFAVVIVKPVLQVMTVRDWRGMEHIPPTGGLLLVANHISHADPLISAHFVYEAHRWPRFLAKSSLFRIPVLGFLLDAVGQIPVHRGTIDAARALEVAAGRVRSGDGVIIYPEGTTTREPDLWPMQGKTGAARLWLATRVPVVPLVMWGPERIFDPRTQKLKLFPRARVTVVAGPPIDLSKWDGADVTTRSLNDITEALMLHLRDMLAEVRGGTPPPLWRKGGTSTVDDSTAGDVPGAAK